MAPEILRGEGQEKYNYKCDLWSIGIIIYRLVFREAPYKGETDTAMLNQIKHFGIKKLKKTNDKELDDLIVKLIEEDPAKRLDWDGYLNHPFFNSNKFIEKIEMRKIVPLIGMAKTGKSSLLNIIYNFDLLYTGNSPTYYIIIIRYNPKIPEPSFFHLKVVKNNEEYSFYKNPDYNVRNGRKEIINEIGNIHNKLTKLKKFNYEDNFYLLEINELPHYIKDEEYFLNHDLCDLPSLFNEEEDNQKMQANTLDVKIKNKNEEDEIYYQLNIKKGNN